MPLEFQRCERRGRSPDEEEGPGGPPCWGASAVVIRPSPKSHDMPPGRSHDSVVLSTSKSPGSPVLVHPKNWVLPLPSTALVRKRPMPSTWRAMLP